MSGGSYNRFFLKLEDFKDELKTTSKPRERLKAMLELLSPVLKKVEYADSGDSSCEAADEAILDFFNEVSKNQNMSSVVEGVANVLNKIKQEELVHTAFHKVCRKMTENALENQISSWFCHDDLFKCSVEEAFATWPQLKKMLEETEGLL